MSHTHHRRLCGGSARQAASAAYGRFRRTGGGQGARDGRLTAATHDVCCATSPLRQLRRHREHTPSEEPIPTAAVSEVGVGVQSNWWRGG
jgi:hypothetical protein